MEAPNEMSVAHTPGPWKVVIDGNPLSAGIVAVIEHSPERHVAVAEDHFGGPWCAPDTWDANARLIAAAPDLLDVLDRLSGFPFGHQGPAEGPLAYILNEARAAIAKAEGR